MKLAYKSIDYLLQNPTPINLVALTKLLMFGIPFNAPHGFKIQEISQEKIKIFLPRKRLNLNHLGGVHACAIATLGEFCGGLGLLTSFGISKYRLIMSKLEADYTFQARKDLYGESFIHFDKKQIEEDLKNSGVSTQTVTTIIKNIDHQVVANVTTTWQIKDWNQVKTKNL